MSKKLPQTTQPQTPGEVQVRDCFETPRYATELIIPFLKRAGVDTIWEPCCGSGRMANVLEEEFSYVRATDLSSGGENVIDIDPGGFCTVTNPPFSLKFPIIDRWLENKWRFAFLVPAVFCGTINRYMDAGCERIVPDRRIDYLTPDMLRRINGAICFAVLFYGGFEVCLAFCKEQRRLNKTKVDGIPISDIEKVCKLETEKTYERLEDVPVKILRAFSSSQFHSMWLTRGLNIGREETRVRLSNSDKNRIL